MKITAEFNSINEIVDFINTFGTKVGNQITIDGAKVGSKIKEKITSPVKEVGKREMKVEEEVPKVEAEQVGQVDDISEIKEAEGVKEVKVTKEQVRKAFSKLSKAGKREEAKELVSKYGASRVPEIKEEDYAAILKEAEELL